MRNCVCILWNFRNTNLCLYYIWDGFYKNSLLDAETVYHSKKSDISILDYYYYLLLFWADDIIIIKKLITNIASKYNLISTCFDLKNISIIFIIYHNCLLIVFQDCVLDLLFQIRQYKEICTFLLSFLCKIYIDYLTNYFFSAIYL